MKKTTALLFIIHCSLFIGTAVFAQNRSAMTVYIPLPTGGTQEQRAYFQSAFQMELIGANYPSVDSRDNSLFTFLLDIQDNPDFDRTLPPDDDNARYFLGIKLERSSDSAEVVSFSFPFSTTDSMNDWNLFLLYQAMANAGGFVPPEAEAPPPEPISIHAPVDNRWRNQWLYLNLAAGVDTGFFQRLGTNGLAWGMAEPLAMAGLEFHFLDFFSLEADPVKPRFINIGIEEQTVYSLAFPLLLKAVFKFSNIMLEPYAGAEYSLALGGMEIPWLSGIAGIQLGFRGSARSAITLDVSGTLGLLEKVRLSDGEDYGLTRITITGGWKLGFFDRTER